MSSLSDHHGRGNRCQSPRRSITAGNHCEQRTDGYFGTGFDDEAFNDADLKALDVDDALVGIDFGDDLTACHGIARFDVPFNERGGLHVRAKAGHDEISHENERGFAPR